VDAAERARECLTSAVKQCAGNLRWKIWLLGARIELNAGNEAAARALQQRALAEVSQKMRGVVRLEQSRLEEYYGQPSAARGVLLTAQAENSGDWRVYLEAVVMELRHTESSNVADADASLDAALARTLEACELHSSTGRLWALLLQLHRWRATRKECAYLDTHKDRGAQDEESVAQGLHALQCTHWRECMRLFRRAVKHVPKSGEVWCEGARLCLDPTSIFFNLRAARKYLKFAMQFTPQYGDQFIEATRLHMLLHGDVDGSASDSGV
jgi:la-related protein 1